MAFLKKKKKKKGLSPKCPKMGPNSGFFEKFGIEKFSHFSYYCLFWYLVSNESLLFALLLYKFHIWVKSGFWDTGYRHISGSMLMQFHEKLKLIFKILVGRCQKQVWPVWLQEPKIGCISRSNRWNKLIFCMLLQIRET